MKKYNVSMPLDGTIEELEFYWKVLIKARAGFKSELSDGTDGLTSHHIAGKPCDELRFSLDNGICCTMGEHKYGYHHTGRAEQYRQRTRILRGNDIYERLEAIKHQSSKGRTYYRDFLLTELKPYREAIEKYFESKNYKNQKIIKQYKYLLEQL